VDLGGVHLVLRRVGLGSYVQVVGLGARYVVVGGQLVAASRKVATNLERPTNRSERVS
jgi:hypothetical protein